MSRSLKGLRILNTRPQNQAQALSHNIRTAGGVAIELPTLEIKACDRNWIQSLPDLKEVDQAIFISANAVHHCFTPLNQQNTVWPPSIQVIAIGQGSAVALRQFNIQINEIPDIPDSEHLLALKSLQQPKEQKILLFKGEGGRPLIEETLAQRGAHLITCSVYQRVMPQISQQFIKLIWHNDLVDIILLTSEQSLHHLFKLFDKDAHDWLCSKTWLIISERLAQIASLSGVKRFRISHPDKVMNALFDYVNKD